MGNKSKAAFDQFISGDLSVVSFNLRDRVEDNDRASTIELNKVHRTILAVQRQLKEIVANKLNHHEKAATLLTEYEVVIAKYPINTKDKENENESDSKQEGMHENVEDIMCDQRAGKLDRDRGQKRIRALSSGSLEGGLLRSDSTTETQPVIEPPRKKRKKSRDKSKGQSMNDDQRVYAQEPVEGEAVQNGIGAYSENNKQPKVVLSEELNPGITIASESNFRLKARPKMKEIQEKDGKVAALDAEIKELKKQNQLQSVEIDAVNATNQRLIRMMEVMEAEKKKSDSANTKQHQERMKAQESENKLLSPKTERLQNDQVRGYQTEITRLNEQISGLKQYKIKWDAIVIAANNSMSCEEIENAMNEETDIAVDELHFKGKRNDDGSGREKGHGRECAAE